MQKFRGERRCLIKYGRWEKVIKAVSIEVGMQSSIRLETILFQMGRIEKRKKISASEDPKSLASQPMTERCRKLIPYQ